MAIPTYNGESFLDETIDSVLAQSFEDFEIVVSDDGSTDRTIDILESFNDPRIRILPDRSRVGAAANWNRAVFSSNAEYLKMLPQDDLLYPQNLEVLVGALDANLHASFAAVQRDVVGADGTVLIRGRGLRRLHGEVDRRTGFRAVARSGSNQFGEGPAVLFRRDAALDVGPFDATAGYAMDLDFWLRLLDWGPCMAVRETHAAFRVSADAWSKQLGKHQADNFADLVRRFAADNSRGVSPYDAFVGRSLGRLNAVLRQAFYLRYREHL